LTFTNQIEGQQTK